MSDRHPSSQAFHDFCDQMKALHDKKQLDYGRAADPFANVRATEEWGQPAWVGAMIRATDKLRRLQKVAQGGTLANEGVEDSFMDLAVYALIGLVLWREDENVDVLSDRLAINPDVLAHLKGPIADTCLVEVAGRPVQMPTPEAVLLRIKRMEGSHGQ